MEDNKQLEVDTEVSAEEVVAEVAEEVAPAEEVAEEAAPVAEVAESVGFFDKVKNFFKNINWKVVYDKTTTGILIFLLSSPLLILLYIFLWFILK